jgi:hypothetical protein
MPTHVAEDKGTSPDNVLVASVGSYFNAETWGEYKELRAMMSR